MEVLLKKTKLTKSVIQQTLHAHYSQHFDLKGYRVLGWVVMHYTKHDLRYYLIYNDKTNEVLRLRFFDRKGVETFEKGVQEDDGKGGYHFPTRYFIKLRYPDYRNSYPYSFNTVEEREKALAVLEEYFKHEDQSQIFI